VEGPARLVETKGYSTTMAISTFRKVEAAQVLQRGAAEGVHMPESRRRERVFGEGGPGRSKALSIPDYTSPNSEMGTIRGQIRA